MIRKLSKVLKINAITFRFGLQQLIKKPTHLTGNSSSHVDLIFRFQSNLVMESGVQFIKNDKQLKENYGAISLLLTCGKILERLIYNKMFEFFTNNELISSNQSGFKSGDSCINQLLCITHDIYQSFDDGPETRAVFLDISKAFDKS